MAMHSVIVTVSVKDKFVKTEVFETKVDDITLSKAAGSNSRKELNPWAKNFFPTAEWVEVISIRRK
jgi:hypothetical protein